MTQHHYTEFAEHPLDLPSPDDADDAEHWSSADAKTQPQDWRSASDLFGDDAE